MNQTILFCIAILTSVSFQVTAQYLNGGTIVKESELFDFPNKDIAEYLGVYKFGDDVQSNVTFRIGKYQNSIFVQVESRYKYEANSHWEHSFMNLNNIKIDSNGNFSSDEFKGKFLTYKGHNWKIKVLKIYEAFTFFDDQAYELGSKIGDVTHGLNGQFPKPSIDILDQTDLSNLSKRELRIMRNEIFARYGYKFKPNGKMASYFDNLHWYHPEFTDVNEFLTALELHNIEIIIAEEKRR
ncbi:MAG: YARHG domain-containing protein [Reichenbachiella sp.]|uniref:YARHG domain-containing protein n=1 Tax=Reichenbachiella sp. TaxID=2184521 RepID=UPI0029663F16|nr:YARHG domain-containing protein [Reichenbachiella sp.]MDW3209717.1 YARHG domain-containing protein [Reichenbachiella sp.]